MFHADLHIHSRFSRACSKNCDAGALAWWAVRKGVTVVGTGDFTHPAWAAELAESLEPAEPGLFRLRPGLQSELRRATPASCEPRVRFLLSAEISTIYKRDGVTRKVHHLIYAPTFEAAGAITAALAKIGNLASDGRPILGLDSRHLLEITLNAGPGCYLVPAHIWTPWFAVLGSKSGFDVITDCYLDLADHIFAVETGLSSDPPMNWMCSALDRYRLVSNSDAHSPPMIGREATTFSTGLDYFAMAEALRTGSGLAGTINFHPEGGRYHLDGHRKCGIRFEPTQTNAHSGICPGCGKPLTIGVLHRVSELADRPPGQQPPGTAGFLNLVSLPEIIGEISGSGPKSKKVIAEVDRLVATFGPELHILCETGLADLSRTGGSLLGEAVARLRRGEVITEAGYDGEYGVIRLMRPEELTPSASLFDLPASQRRCRTRRGRDASHRCHRHTRRERHSHQRRGGRGRHSRHQRPSHQRAAAGGGRHRASARSGNGRPGTGRIAAGRSRPRSAGGGGGGRTADDHRGAGHGQDPHAHLPHRGTGIRTRPAARGLPRPHLHPPGGPGGA